MATKADLVETFNAGLDPVPDTAYHRAAAEYFTPSIWPAAPAGLRPVWGEYLAAMQALAERILGLMAEALGLGGGFFAPLIDQPMASITANHYPALDHEPAGRPVPWRRPHRLRLDHAAGDRRRPGPPAAGRATARGRRRRPVPGAFHVNTGDMLAHWSGGHWRSTWHRVVPPPGGPPYPERTSIAYFHSPNADAVIAPLPGRPAVEFEPVLAGRYLPRQDRRYYAPRRGIDEDASTGADPGSVIAPPNGSSTVLQLVYSSAPRPGGRAGRRQDGDATMTIFISYARKDAQPVATLRAELENLRGGVWIDQRLAGGQDWWSTILAAIRDADLFVFTVSRAALASEACLSELGYAMRTHRPVLPVAVADFDPAILPDQLQRLQVVSYLGEEVDKLRALTRALLQLPSAPSLPDPLPAEPDLPRSYGDEFRQQLAQPTLTRDEQIQLAAVLKVHSVDPLLAEDALDLLPRAADASRRRPRRRARRRRLPERTGVGRAPSLDERAAAHEQPADAAPAPDDPSDGPAPVSDDADDWRRWLSMMLRGAGAKLGLWYVQPDIPAKKLRNSAAATETDESDVIAVCDRTVFGSAKDCIVFTTSSVKANYMGDKATIDYADLADRVPVLEDDDVRFGETLFLTGEWAAAAVIDALVAIAAELRDR